MPLSDPELHAFLSSSRNGTRITCRVQPRASRTALAGGANSWRNCSIGRNHPSLWFRDRQDAIKSSKFRTSPCRKPQASSEINKSPHSTFALSSQRQPEKTHGILPQLIHPGGASSLCDSIAKATRSSGKEGSARGEEPLPRRSVQPLRFRRKGDQKFRERGEREGRRTAFQSGFRLSHKNTSNKKYPAMRRSTLTTPLPHRVNYFADFSVFPEPAGAWQEYARPHRNFPTIDEWDAATGH